MKYVNFKFDGNRYECLNKEEDYLGRIIYHIFGRLCFETPVFTQLYENELREIVEFMKMKNKENKNNV